MVRCRRGDGAPVVIGDDDDFESPPDYVKRQSILVVSGARSGERFAHPPNIIKIGFSCPDTGALLAP
jgi:hypothetical protein